MKRPIFAAVALALAAAPATASAATIELDGSGTIVYSAEPGELNRLQMSGTVGGPFDFRMEFFEHAAPLTAGTGCSAGFPVLCGAVDQAFPVDVSLGDEDDVANVNSFTENLTLNAGSGDDDVLAGGIDAGAHGQGGDDTIRLAANNITTGTGGSGDDRISGGLGAAAAILDGGSGRDLLVPDGFAFNDAKGGWGRDRLVSLKGFEVILDGQAGRDVLVAAGGDDVALTGGSGSDVISSQLGGVTVDAGPGRDVVDVHGGDGDDVTCGPSWDVVWADASDSVAPDCELVLRRDPPALPFVAATEDAAHDLLDHTPDPS